MNLADIEDGTDIKNETNTTVLLDETNKMLDKVERYLEEDETLNLLGLPEKLHDYQIIATWHISSNLAVIVGMWTGPVKGTEYVVSTVTPQSLEWNEWDQGFYTEDMVKAHAKFSELVITNSQDK